MNPKVPLPACTNVSEIAASYNQGPAEMNSWDKQFWDRPYMPERELAVMERNGRVCKTPCFQTYFNLEPSYVHRNRYFIDIGFNTRKSMMIFRTVPFEYGPKDWVFGIKFLYETLLQEERYMVYVRSRLQC